MSPFSSKTISSSSPSPHTTYGPSPSRRIRTDCRLTLPGNVIEDDDSTAKYDIASGILTIALTKVHQGEHFPDLDLTNRLLARTGETIDSATGKPNPPPKIVLASTSPSDSYTRGDFDDAIEYDFQLPQTIPPAETEGGEMGGDKYGFNNQYSGVFTYLQNTDVLTCVEPEGKTAAQRWHEMRAQEDRKWDPEWYIVDKLDPPADLHDILLYTPNIPNDAFTAAEQSQLQNLGMKDCTTP